MLPRPGPPRLTSTISAGSCAAGGQFSVTAAEALITYLAFCKDVDYEINGTSVAAIEINGYGILAFLPNTTEDGNYCVKHWNDEEINFNKSGDI